jgi:hypothetical protein
MITIVSGLPRTGTSMTMQILEAGGMSILSDHVRKADISNPKGYYEFEMVKELKNGNTEWLSKAEGKAVKIISPLLFYLPQRYVYRVIFMLRDLDEVLRSQNKMLETQKVSSRQSDDLEMRRVFDEHLLGVKNWLAVQDNFSTLYLNYRDIVGSPERWAASINNFIDGVLDVDRMIDAVDASLNSQGT